MLLLEFATSLLISNLKALPDAVALCKAAQGMQHEQHLPVGEQAMSAVLRASIVCQFHGPGARKCNEDGWSKLETRHKIHLPVGTNATSTPLLA